VYLIAEMLRFGLGRLAVALLIGSSLVSSLAFADDENNFLVLGIISSTAKQPGVALVKSVADSRTFAVRVGSDFGKKIRLKSVNRKTVEVVMNNKSYFLRVGDETAGAQQAFIADTKFDVAPESFERHGDTVKVSSQIRDHIVNNKLSAVLMQAAAVPYMVAGRLAGFTFWDIESKSVFEMAGLKNGDTVTSINGFQITDVGATIRMLNSLRKENNAQIEFMRDGQPQKLNLSIQ